MVGELIFSQAMTLFTTPDESCIYLDRAHQWVARRRRTQGADGASQSTGASLHAAGQALACVKCPQPMKGLGERSAGSGDR